jgi:hypothetical protein
VIRRLLLAGLLSLIVIATGIWTLLNEVEAGGRQCGGRPLSLIGRALPFAGLKQNESGDCRDAATSAVILGFTVIGFGIIMAVGSTLILVSRPSKSEGESRTPVSAPQHF